MPTLNSSQVQLTTLEEIVPYAAQSYADAYFASTITKNVFWATLTDAEKDAALKEATLNIDELHYIGNKLELAQRREWPRYLDLESYGDIFYLEQQILEIVGRACCEQAWFLARNAKQGYDPENRQEHQMMGVNSINRVGASESSDINKARRHRVCRAAYQLLLPFIVRTANLEAPYYPPTSRQ